MYNRFLPVLLILSLICTCIEVDISVPSFPEIAQYFNVAESIIQLTITYNFLGFCLGAVIYGPLSECYGRRKVMLVGNGILLAGALGCVYAPSIDFLLVSRFIQGIGASTSIVLVFTMIADIYKGEKAMKLIGITNATLAATIAIAPILGGIINQLLGWRGNYGFVAFISFISWSLLIFMLPETKQEMEKLSIKNIVNDYRKLLFSYNFMRMSLIPSLLFSAYMVFISASAFLYINTFGMSVMSFVAHQVIVVASFAITSLFADIIVQSLKSNKTIKLGIGLSILGTFLLILSGIVQPQTAWLVTVFMSIFCIGFAICYPVIFTGSLQIFPELRGTASSFIMSIRALLVTGFTWMVSYFYTGELITVSIVIFSGVLLALIFTVSLLSANKMENSITT